LQTVSDSRGNFNSKVFALKQATHLTDYIAPLQTTLLDSHFF